MKRKKAIPATFIVGFVLSIALNADSIAIARYLYSHPEESKKFADKAMSDYQKYKTTVDSLRNTVRPADTTRPSVEKVAAQTQKLQKEVIFLTNAVPPALPLGWSREPYDFKKDFFSSVGKTIAGHGIGWLASILAICLGAPFWFDLLNKIANLRSSGPKPSTTDQKNAS